ncbi:DEAD/DEAH box helicase, partial [Streptomyces rimosus]
MSVSTDQSVLPAADEQAPQQDQAVAETVTEAAEVTEAAAQAESPETAESPEDAAPQITFADLGLDEKIVRKLAANGVTTPFPIQAATIPDALAGRDILGRGRTGSGKTLSFGLPLLSRLAGGHTAKKRPRGVILTPTRELAMQVSDALQPYGDVLGLKLKVVCGGTSMGNQIYALERGVDVLVATPGRLRDIINRGACSLDDVETAVLDEADQMADLGFLPEVTELLDLIPSGGQRMLFSATMENEIGTLVKRYLTDPATHEVDAAQGAVTTMTHHVLVVKPKDKAPVTAAIAARKGRTIIFVRTQLGADRVAEQLCDSGVRADALHGGMTQGARTRTLADFKDGYVNVLVATDVAARGIHVDGIDLVLNVDPAGDHKDYLHRSGRTARAGQSGTVVSLALPHQRRQIFRLMEDAGVDASRHIVGGAGAFDEDVARITGARSLTEVQADSATNSAKQAAREAQAVSYKQMRAQRRAAELREEANRLTARAARERGEDPEEAVAAAEAAVEEAAEAVVPAQAAPEADEAPRRSTYRDERGNYERRDRRDNDRGDRGGDRGGFRRDDRSGGGFNRDRRDDRSGGGFNRDRRDDRSGGGFRRDVRARGAVIGGSRDVAAGRGNPADRA